MKALKRMIHRRRFLASGLAILTLAFLSILLIGKHERITSADGSKLYRFTAFDWRLRFQIASDEQIRNLPKFNSGAALKEATKSRIYIDPRYSNYVISTVRYRVSFDGPGNTRALGDPIVNFSW